MPIPISAIVITKNEELNLPDCLASIAWADEVLVVDSFSADRTQQVAENYGARFIQHAFENFAAQRNFAQRQAKYDWVFFVDADERVPPELRRELEQLKESDELARFNAYHIRRVHLISGRWFGDPKPVQITRRLADNIRRNEVSRLFDRRQARWERAIHEQVIVPEPHAVLASPILHFASTNFSLMLKDINKMTDLEAARLQHGRKSARPPSAIEAVARGFRLFIFVYFGWKLYKLGQIGLHYALISAFVKYLNYAKLGERIRIQNNDGLWTPQDTALLSQFIIDDNKV
jgi:glycosyltransferase involved in cell wall biosynthesis